MPLFEDRLRRIFERLAKLRGGSSTPSQDGLTHLTEAVDDLTRAIENVEGRLQALEQAGRPNGIAHS